jgi:hypothetical protein
MSKLLRSGRSLTYPAHFRAIKARGGHPGAIAGYAKRLKGTWLAFLASVRWRNASAHKESLLRISQLAVCRFALFWEQFDVRFLSQRLRQVSVAGDLIDENARSDRKINLVTDT